MHHRRYSSCQDQLYPKFCMVLWKPTRLNLFFWFTKPTYHMPTKPIEIYLRFIIIVYLHSQHQKMFQIVIFMKYPAIISIGFQHSYHQIMPQALHLLKNSRIITIISLHSQHQIMIQTLISSLLLSCWYNWPLITISIICVAYLSCFKSIFHNTRIAQRMNLWEKTFTLCHHALQLQSPYPRKICPNFENMKLL